MDKESEQDQAPKELKQWLLGLPSIEVYNPYSHFWVSFAHFEIDQAWVWILDSEGNPVLAA